MNVSLLASISLGVTFLVAAISLLIPAWLVPRGRPSSAPSAASALALGAAALLVLFVLALRTAPPFSPGQRFALGLLIGGAIGLKVLWQAARMVVEDASYRPYAVVYACASAIAGLSLALLLFSGDPEAALFGCALGFGMAAGIGLVVLGGPAGAAPGVAALLAAAVAAGSVLAQQRFAATAQRGWWAYPMCLAAAWLLGHAMAYFAIWRRDQAARRPAASLALSASAGGIAAIVFGWLLATRLEPPQAVFAVLLAGLVTGGLVTWLSLVEGRDGEQSAAAARGAALSALLMLFLLVASFRALHGFGAAVALIAASGFVAASAAGSRRGSTPAAALALGANFLLLRLFLGRGGTLTGELDASLHYTLIGVILGALLPLLYAALHTRQSVTRAMVLGLLTAASPPIVLGLWGPDAGVGLLAGLVVAPAIAAIVGPFVPGRWADPAPLMAVGMALVTVQFDRSFVLLYELPRAAKMGLAGGVAFVVVLWVVGAGLAGARAPRPTAQEG